VPPKRLWSASSAARLLFRTAVDWTFGAHDEHRFRAESVNISEMGMLLEPSGGLDVGGELTVKFALPLPPGSVEITPPRRRRSMFVESVGRESGPRKLRAKVVHKTPPDIMGVQFVSLTPQDRAVLQRFIFGRAAL